MAKASSKSSSIAQALVGQPQQNPVMWEPGLEQPDIDPILALTGGLTAAGPKLAKLFASRGLRPAAKMALETLPEIQSGAKVGDPHALFAFKDNFGPKMAERELFNVYGDPANPLFKKVGWGSSVTKDILDKAGIPVTGKQKARAFLNARNNFSKL